MRPLLVCPTRYESRQLARAGLGEAWDIVCCGPGTTGVRRWASSVTLEPAQRPVILAGLGGALGVRAPLGAAFVIFEVVSSDGTQRWQPSIVAPDAQLRVTSSNDVVTSPTARSELGLTSGADVVDMESVAFAECAYDRGWRWGVVRGISDTAEQSLPPDSAHWMNDRGALRPGRLALSLLRHPGLVSDLPKLQRHGAAAMQAVIDVLAKLRVDETAPPGQA